jgi:hypothetical protein
MRSMYPMYHPRRDLPLEQAPTKRCAQQAARRTRLAIAQAVATRPLVPTSCRTRSAPLTIPRSFDLAAGRRVGKQPTVTCHPARASTLANR